MRKSFLLSFFLKKFKRLNTPAAIINFSFKRYKGSPFLIQPDKQTALTFQELENRVQKLGSFFYESGLKSGDVVAFTAENTYEYFEIRAACHLAGLVFLGLPINLAPEDRAYFLNKTKAKILFYKNRLHVAPYNTGNTTPATQVIALDGIAYKKIFQRPYTIAKSKPGSCSSTATLNVSSGTTQKTPKIVQLSNQNWTESLYNYIRNADAGLNKDIVFLCMLPFVTAGSTTFLPSFLSGLKYIIVKEDTSPEALVHYIKKHKVTRLYLTPSRLLELLEWGKAKSEKLPSLKQIITGTERMPPLRLREAIEFFGPIIYMGYGMVEALPPLTLLSPKEYCKLDSVGRIAKGVKIEILKDGRIAIRTKTVSNGYLDNPGANSERFKRGWFYSDDYGYLDKEGFLYVWGRKEEILTTEPRHIFAKELEERLYRISFIHRCMAIGKNGKVYVFASLRKEMDPKEAEQEIYGLCTAGLDGLIMPDRIIIKRRLPINSLGKLDRRTLVEDTVWQK